MSNLVVNKEKDTVLIKNVRLSYPHLFKPWAKNPSDEKKYGATFIFPLDTHKQEVIALRKYIEVFSNEKLGKKLAPSVLCLRDGNLTEKEELRNCWYLTSNEKKAPAVLDRKLKPIKEEDDIVYGGCYVNALIRIWAYRGSHPDRICANVKSVQFVADGERFGSSPIRPEEHFDVLDDGDLSSDDDDDMSF